MADNTMAAKLANALRDMLRPNNFPKTARARARKVLNDFDNAGGFDYPEMPEYGTCLRCREPVQPESRHPNLCPFCTKPVSRP